MENVFRKCDILLPYYASDSEDWKSWSVIACDQHTSEPSYWEETERIAKGHPSTLGLILPEAYLGTAKEAEKKEQIRRHDRLPDSFLKTYAGCMIYVERTLESGMIRRGIVGAIDLDSYDFEKGSAPDVRPTEGTVRERIPPRVAVRAAASYEASHVMLFCECKEVFDYLTSEKDSLRILYDFDLMQGGGHITGRLICGEALEAVEEMIGKYERERRSSGRMIYGVGDGNHSLASAKAYYEKLKSEGTATDAAAEALVELVPITERAIVFEPIYKTVTGVESDKFISYIKNTLCASAACPCEVEVRHSGKSEKITIDVPEGELICGVLQSAIDSYISENGGKCDYIHGKDNLISLADDGAVGFIFDGIDKADLFPFVSKNGVLPRKAFSMGEACEKRYYTELRRLK